MEWEENVPKKAYKMCQEAGVTVSGFNDDDEIAAKNASEADTQEEETLSATGDDAASAGSGKPQAIGSAVDK